MTRKAKMSKDLFESHKQVKNCPMNRADYNMYRGWELPADEDGADEGYLVEYLDGGTPNDKRHKGYISWTPKAQFDGGYTKVGKVPVADGTKSLGNTNVSKAKDNVPDLVVFGNGDMFKLLSKASSQNEGWMKSTKAMEIPGVGVVVQVTTQQGSNVAEAVTFVPGACILGQPGERRIAKIR